MNEKRNDYYATVLASIFEADEIILSTELTNIYTKPELCQGTTFSDLPEAEQLINSGVHLVYRLYHSCVQYRCHGKGTPMTQNRTALHLPMIRKAVLKAKYYQDSVTFCASHH